jgi:hypothetical protein
MALFQSTFMGFSCISIPSAILCCKSMGNSRSDIFIFIFYLLFIIYGVKNLDAHEFFIASGIQ